jgi:hypothetical protein
MYTGRQPLRALNGGGRVLSIRRLRVRVPSASLLFAVTPYNGISWRRTAG